MARVGVTVGALVGGPERVGAGVGSPGVYVGWEVGNFVGGSVEGERGCVCGCVSVSVNECERDTET